MQKSILVLNGSPRPNGNTTALVQAFCEGAMEAGHAVANFRLHSIDIRPCLGCQRGGQGQNNPCSQQDDMADIYKAYCQSEVLVLASPLYYWTYSAQLKTAIDRLYAVTEANGEQPPYKEVVLLVAAGGDGYGNFAPLVAYHEAMLHRLGWKDLGQVLAGGVDKVGDIAGHPALQEARRLGRSLS